MITKRFGALLAVLGLVLTACGSGSATGTPTQGTATSTPGTGATGTPAASASTAETPVEGGTLVVGLDGDMAYADPALVSDGNSIYVAAQVVQGLVGLKPGTINDVIPVLASDMPTVSADSKTYTFKLRTGINFSDGTPFNADAVVYNYQRWQGFDPNSDLGTNEYYYPAVFGGFGTSSDIASITAPDEQTVVFQLKHPLSNFLLSQTLQVFGIESPTALKNMNADATPLASNKYANGQAQENMVGTGPFMFKEWVPGDHVTLVKNPNYWDTANAAHLDQITFNVALGDSTAKLQALQSGSIDFAETIAATDVPAAQGAGLTIIDRGDSCNLGYLGMNQNLGGKATIYADKNVRLAIASALNNASYIKAFYGANDKVPQSWMPPATIGFKAETLPTYNLQTAQADLAAANLTTTQKAIDLYYPSNVVRPYMPDPKDLAQAIASDLTAAGFTVNLKTEDWHASYVHDATNGKLPLFLFGWTCDWAGADDFISAGFFGYQGGQPNLQFGYKNDQINRTCSTRSRRPRRTRPTRTGAQRRTSSPRTCPRSRSSTPRRLGPTPPRSTALSQPATSPSTSIPSGSASKGCRRADRRRTQRRTTPRLTPGGRRPSEAIGP